MLPSRAVLLLGEKRERGETCSYSLFVLNLHFTYKLLKSQVSRWRRGTGRSRVISEKSGDSYKLELSEPLCDINIRWRFYRLGKSDRMTDSGGETESTCRHSRLEMWFER